MLSTSFSYLLLASSAFTSSVSAGRFDIRKRNLYSVQKNVIVTEQVDVIKFPDGSISTGRAVPVETVSYLDKPTFASIAPQATSTSLSTQSQATTPPAPFKAKDTEPEAPTQPVNPPSSPTEDSPNGDNPSDTNDEPAAPVAPTPEVPTTPPTPPTTEPEVEPTTPEIQPAPPVANPSPNVDPQPAPPAANPSPNVDPQPAPQNPSTPPAHDASKKSGKRGLAFNDVSKLAAFSSSSKVSWAYNWGSSTPNLPNNYEYVPMLWGLGEHSAGWNHAADKAIASGSTHLLAFNEPDLAAQSSLSIPLAVDGYRSLMQPYAGKAKLGSPAVTNGGAPMGLTYLQNFISSCSGCTIDFVNIHWYNGGNAQDFKNYVTKAHAAGGGRPVWITEFEASGDTAQQQAFLNDVLPWLDSQDYVERYAYFMAADGILISSGTTLSPVGQAFAS
ncbi:hypothetical protein BGHDH14_bgh02974 [Blumeria hordei DH14]|uniref:Asl1-like glycosyl hydrolase catalytic domain-containing protein n=1 Tax=Blumeria graminis f. sp. hordei (strain DH14) TaxID=546991 RepID=N1JKY8_BLUG1|nr:hypothetical protein BGHDH14_bgh02974 [Blumeria hordei DH14]